LKGAAAFGLALRVSIGAGDGGENPWTVRRPNRLENFFFLKVVAQDLQADGQSLRTEPQAGPDRECRPGWPKW